MRFAANYDYPVPPAAVAALMADRDYLLAAAAAAGAESSQIEVVRAANGGFTVTIRSTMPPDQLPAAVRAFLPQGLELRQALVWEPPAARDADAAGAVGATGAAGARQATMAGEVAGAAVRLSGLMRLTPTASGCRSDFGGEVNAQLPLVGRAVEEAAVPAVVKVLDAQHRVALDWLDAAAPQTA
ncbi:MAG: DUF2505 domain-containing protein [Bifidobacteriaceae bacterium]|jgi:hypothetical protein|nr:DUF2505 domain-containing protein [Bifidobacteriaceae bacterium]